MTSTVEFEVTDRNPAEADVSSFHVLKTERPLELEEKAHLNITSSLWLPSTSNRSFQIHAHRILAPKTIDGQCLEAEAIP